MTAAEVIGVAIGITTAALILIHQHHEATGRVQALHAQNKECEK